MTPMQDMELLRQYVAERSQRAFSAIVEQYAGMVYSSALRQTGDAHLAEDVTQTVFVELSRKAASLRPRVVVGSWLLIATRYAVQNARKQLRRRHYHEQRAAMMRNETREAPRHGAWEEIAPHLDAALARLSRHNRDALVLRYFQSASMQAVAQRLGISEEAARQRISRGLEQVRSILSRRGVTVPTAVLGESIALCAVQSPPPALVQAAVAAGASSVSKGVLITMAVSKTKAAALVAASLLLLGGGSVVTWLTVRQQRTDAIVLPPMPAPADTQESMQARYGLAEGQCVKLVEAPFIAARQAFWVEDQQRRGNPRPEPLGNDVSLVLKTEGQTFQWRSMSAMSSLAYVLQRVANLKPEDLDASVPASMAIPGDWVIRKGATSDQILEGVGQVLSRKLHRDVRLERRSATRDAVVVRGSLHFVPLPGHPDDGVVEFVGDKVPGVVPRRIQKVTLTEVFSALARRSRLSFIDETGQGNVTITVADHPEYGSARALLRNIATQTSLHFEHEARPADLWFLVDSHDGAVIAAR